MNKNIDYLKEKLIITFKTMKEYRANFYANFLSDIFNIITILIFYSTYMKLMDNSLLNWNLFNFLTFFLIVNFSVKFRNCFFFWNFNSYIIRGGLNTLLTKPINVYLQIVSNAWRSGRVFTTTIIFIFTISIIIIGENSNYILAFLIWIIGFVGNVFLYNGIEILKFFIKKGINLKDLTTASHSIVRTFTFAPFENNNLISVILLGLFPMALVSYIVFQILNGKINYFYDYILYFIIYTIIIISLNISLWHYGLKKYEAYG